MKKIVFSMKWPSLIAKKTEFFWIYEEKKFGRIDSWTDETELQLWTETEMQRHTCRHINTNLSYNINQNAKKTLIRKWTKNLMTGFASNSDVLLSSSPLIGLYQVKIFNDVFFLPFEFESSLWKYATIGTLWLLSSKT